MGLFDAILRRGRKASDELAKKVDVDDVSKGRMAIEDSKKEIGQFTQQIAELRGAQRRNERTAKSQEEEIKKHQTLFENIKAKAESCKNKDGSTKKGEQGYLDKARIDGQKVLDQIETLESTKATLDKQIQRDSALYDSLSAKLQEARSKIARAEQNITSLACRQKSAAIRKKLASASQGIDDGKGLSALDDLQASVDKDESEAEALEELAGVGDTSSIADDYAPKKEVGF